MIKRGNGSLSNLVDAAFERAAVQVIERAKQTETPVILWEENGVKVVVPEALEAVITRKKSRARRRGRR
jgi:hypothetical protein